MEGLPVHAFDRLEDLLRKEAQPDDAGDLLSVQGIDRLQDGEELYGIGAFRVQEEAVEVAALQMLHPFLPTVGELVVEDLADLRVCRFHVRLRGLRIREDQPNLPVAAEIVQDSPEFRQPVVYIVRILFHELLGCGLNLFGQQVPGVILEKEMGHCHFHHQLQHQEDEEFVHEPGVVQIVFPGGAESLHLHGRVSFSCLYFHLYPESFAGVNIIL